MTRSASPAASSTARTRAKADAHCFAETPSKEIAPTTSRRRFFFSASFAAYAKEHASAAHATSDGDRACSSIDSTYAFNEPAPADSMISETPFTTKAASRSEGSASDVFDANVATLRFVAKSPSSAATPRFRARSARGSLFCLTYTENARSCVSARCEACFSSRARAFAASSSGVFVASSFSPRGSGSGGFSDLAGGFFPSLAAASAAAARSAASFSARSAASFSARSFAAFCFLRAFWRSSLESAASAASSAAAASAGGSSCTETYAVINPRAASRNLGLSYSASSCLSISTYERSVILRMQ